MEARVVLALRALSVFAVISRIYVPIRRRAGIALPPERAITWITRNAARMIGLEDRIGTLEPGKIADIVVWSGDPFSIYTHADRVYVDGALAFDRADPARTPVPDFELGQPAREAAP